MIGRRIGSYEVVGKLGEGGMGEVYRAHDTTLNRDVAIKVLPEAFARDPERLARFRREAESLAALNHPHIAQVYGFDASDGTHAIVMELVPGRPLSDHIGGTGLPIDEVLGIARQVALALEAAHQRDIVHRDLKPANIMVRDDGVVKVLDFGLAKALVPEAAGASGDAMTSPAHTALGLILGTAAYMAPEQARGKPVDRRADLWAFGCVVYEMLTGRSPFRGEDVQQTLANILNAAPDFTSLPPATPASIKRLLRRCLARDRAERLADAASARLEIDDAMKGPSADGGSAGLTASSPWWWRPVPWPAAAAVAAIGIAGVLWMRPSAPRTPASMVTRLDIAVPIGDELSDPTDAGGGPAITADGRTVFYVGRRAGISHVFRRRLDEANAEIVPGTEGALRAYLYPSDDWLAFSTNRPAGLKRLPLAGGPATPVLVAQSNVLGIAFTAAGELVFGSQGGNLFRVPASGDKPEVLLRMGDDGPLRFPVALPENRGLLLTVGGVPVSNRIAVLSPGADAPRFLTGGTDARYLPTGHVVFWRDGSLFAAAFDLDRLELAGDAVPVVQGVGVRGNGSASFAVSPNGTLAYINAVGAPARTLVWVDRQGNETALKATPGPYAAPRLSPDGQKVLLGYRTNATEDIWVHDITRQVTEPFVNEPASEWVGIWAANSERVFFSSRRSGPFRLYGKRLNGLGGIDLVGSQVMPFGLNPDGSGVIVQSAAGVVSLLTIADGSTRPLWDEDGGVPDARLSPDGRWIAYVAVTPRGPQIWMRPYPDVHSNRLRISPDGGRLPRWSPNSRTIFYRRGADMMAVDLGGDGAAPVPAAPVRLFDGPYLEDFDIGRDGRFLMIKEPASPPPSERRIVVVLNWFQELIARVSRR